MYIDLKKNTIRKGDGQAVAIPSGVIKRGNEWEIPKLNGCFHGKINDKMIANGQLISWFHGAFCGGHAQVPDGMAPKDRHVQRGLFTFGLRSFSGE